MKNSKLKRFVDCFLNLDVILGIACLTVLVVITFLGAIMRYFFNNPFIWLEEVQIWMIIWAIFSGAGYAFRKGSHVSIDVLVDAFPRKIQTIIDWFGFFCTLAMLIYVGFYGFKLNMQFLDMGKITSILKIPSCKIYWIVPIGCIWMMMSYAYYMIEKYFLQTLPGEPEKEGTL
jgi:C4-dicarboxylate transporter DctQ subunit